MTTNNFHCNCGCGSYISVTFDDYLQISIHPPKQGFFRRVYNAMVGTYQDCYLDHQECGSLSQLLEECELSLLRLEEFVTLDPKVLDKGPDT